MADEGKDKDWKKELRDLGFPEAVIESSEEARKNGLFAMEPSPDLVEKTIEACKPFLPKPQGPK